MKTNTLSDILSRLKLKYKIDNGIIYCVIEDGDILAYPQVRPAYPYEIAEIKETAYNARIDAILKSYSDSKKTQ